MEIIDATGKSKRLRWNPFGMIKGVLATAEEIPAIGKLGQYDQVRSTVCRFCRQCKTLTQIVGSVVHANLRVQLDDGYAWGACKRACSFSTKARASASLRKVTACWSS